jgi:hypothetical protein
MKNFKQYITEGSIKNEIKELQKKYPDANVTFKKKSAGTIVYVNGQTAYNQDDNSFGSHEKIMFALERAYKAAKGITEGTSLAGIIKKIKTNCVVNFDENGTIEIMGEDKKEVEKTAKEIEKKVSKLVDFFEMDKAEPLEHSDGLDFEEGFYIAIEFGEVISESEKFSLIITDSKIPKNIRLSNKEVNILQNDEYTHNGNNEFKLPSKKAKELLGDKFMKTNLLESEINEKNIVDKKQLQWILKTATSADNLDSFIADIELMIQMSK